MGCNALFAHRVLDGVPHVLTQLCNFFWTHIHIIHRRLPLTVLITTDTCVAHLDFIRHWFYGICVLPALRPGGVEVDIRCGLSLHHFEIKPLSVQPLLVCFAVESWDIVVFVCRRLLDLLAGVLEIRTLPSHVRYTRFLRVLVWLY